MAEDTETRLIHAVGRLGVKMEDAEELAGNVPFINKLCREKSIAMEPKTLGYKLTAAVASICILSFIAAGADFYLSTRFATVQAAETAHSEIVLSVAKELRLVMNERDLLTVENKIERLENSGINNPSDASRLRRYTLELQRLQGLIDEAKK